MMTRVISDDSPDDHAAAIVIGAIQAVLYVSHAGTFDWSTFRVTTDRAPSDPLWSVHVTIDTKASS
jgi:hypothetical protein